jgi:hypothetical protein
LKAGQCVPMLDREGIGSPRSFGAIFSTKPPSFAVVFLFPDFFIFKILGAG